MSHPDIPDASANSPVTSAARRLAFGDLAAAIATLAALVGVALVLVACGGVYYSEWAQDTFIPLEGALHVLRGQWPHRDFVTPVGSLWYVINAIPGLVMPLSARLIVWANLIVALTGAIATLVVCRRKLPHWLACLCAFYVGLVAMSPRQVGESLHMISNNASYNRYCWSLICAIAMASLLPAPAGTARRRDPIDGIVVGLLIAICFYIKITYAAAGVGFVGLALITSRGPAAWRFGMWAGIVATGTVVAAAVLTHDLPGYIADMKTAVAVLPDASRSGQLLLLLIWSLPGMILVVLLSLRATALPGKNLGAFGPGAWAGLLTVGAGLAIGVQNHPEPENPLLPVGLMVGWIVSRQHHTGPVRSSTRFGYAVIGAAFAIMMAGDLGAVAWTTIAPVETSANTGWLRDTRVSDLRIGIEQTGPKFPDKTQPQNDGEIFGVLNEAVVLLRPHLQGRHDARVLPFNWNNPFPVLLGLPPIRHEAAWWDPERTFNAKLAPAPHALLDGVDYILIRTEYRKYLAERTMWDVYGALVLHDFKPVGHSHHWTLWARKTCAVRSLC